jgi:hypothetical protein
MIPHLSASQTPVILFGALRSGTTMFRLILNCHERLSNPGETDFLLDHIRPDPSHPTGWRYDRAALAEDRIFRARAIPCPPDLDGLDLMEAMIAALAEKAPDRRLVLVFHRNAPKFARLLPGAPVLHLLRDPRDVARSSIGMGWAGNSYYGVRHWLATERGWDAAGLPEDRVLTVRFEALMRDIEGELGRVCTFLGLPYSEAMLRYPETTTYEAPDPKIAQQWRRKASPREIARIEAAARDMMLSRGYPPEASPHRIGRPEAAWLALTHRVRRWRFNVARYGLWLFAGPHLARALGLNDLETSLLRRQAEIKIRDAK